MMGEQSVEEKGGRGSSVNEDHTTSEAGRTMEHSDSARALAGVSAGAQAVCARLSKFEERFVAVTELDTQDDGHDSPVVGESVWKELEEAKLLRRVTLPLRTTEDKRLPGCTAAVYWLARPTVNATPVEAAAVAEPAPTGEQSRGPWPAARAPVARGLGGGGGSCKIPALKRRRAADTGADAGVPGDSQGRLEVELAKLRQRCSAAERECGELVEEGLVETELEEHMRLLHEYNEMKDMGQMMLGQLAIYRGVTTKSLYEQFGMELRD